MIARWILALVLLSVQTNWTQAQTARQVELAYRFVPGNLTHEQVRVVGELHILSGSESIPVTIDLAGLATRKVTAVAPSGAATVTIAPISVTMRMTIADQQIFSLQDRKGVTTLLNGEPRTTAGNPPKEIAMQIGRGGQMSAVTSAGDDAASKLLGAMPASAVAFPDRSVAIGERWRSSTRMSFPRLDAGGPMPSMPDIATTSDSELRSLQIEQGRLVATVVTTADGTSNDGASKQRTTVTSRFDVEAGELIESEGELAIDLELSDPAEPNAAAGKAHLAGQIHFSTTMLSSRMTAIAPDAAPAAPPPPPTPVVKATPPVAPPPAGPVSLGASYDGWSLSGGQILRYYGSPSEQACRSDCDHDSACQGYSWVKPGGYTRGDPPVCYLMRSYQSAAPNRCCVAATRGPFPGR